jgi:mRNA interferase MazF
MEKLVKGDIVVIPFPYSDLSNTKRRPAFVITSFPNMEVILCQITSQKPSDSYSVRINNSDFADGSLHQESFIRINRIFTADQNIVLYKAGSLQSNLAEEIINKVICLIRS